jgi:hypothetical protein
VLPSAPPAIQKEHIMPEPDEATVAVSAIWQVLGGIESPNVIADAVASTVAIWAEAAGGRDPRVRAALVEALVGAVDDTLARRAAMVAPHE